MEDIHPVMFIRVSIDTQDNSFVDMFDELGLFVGHVAHYNIPIV